MNKIYAVKPASFLRIHHLQIARPIQERGFFGGAREPPKMSPVIHFLSRAYFDNRDQQCGIIDFKDSAVRADTLMVIRIPLTSFCRAVRIFR